MDIEMLTEALLKAVISDTSAKELIRLAYGYIKKPIIAFDAAFRLYGYAFDRPLGFEPWETIAREHYLPDDYIYNNGSLDYQQVLYDSRSSVCLDYGTARDYPQVCAPVMYAGRLLGYVGIAAEGCTDIAGLLKANDILASALGTVIGRKLAVRHDRDFDMGSIMNSMQPTRQQNEYVRKHFKAPYITAILCSDRSNAPTLEYVNQLIQQEYGNAVTDNGQERKLSLFFYGIDERKDPEELSAYMDMVTGRYGLSCGISDWYEDPALIPQARMQAELTEALVFPGGHGKRSLLFRDHMYELMYRSAEERYGSDICAAPGIRNLTRGVGNARDIERTVDNYLLYGGSPTQAARSMGIHKNTVYYRLNGGRRRTESMADDPEYFTELSVGIIFGKYRAKGEG